MTVLEKRKLDENDGEQSDVYDVLNKEYRQDNLEDKAGELRTSLNTIT